MIIDKLWIKKWVLEHKNTLMLIFSPIILCIVSLLYWVYTIKQIEPLSALPQSTTVLVFDSPDLKKLTKNLQTLPYLDALRGIGPIQKFEESTMLLDSLMEYHADESFRLKLKHCIAALQVSSISALDWMYVVDFKGESFTLEHLELWKVKKMRKSLFRGIDIYSIELEKGEKFSFAKYKNLLIASPSTLVVEIGIEQLDQQKDNLEESRDFYKGYKQLFGDSNLKLYWSFENFPLLSRLFLDANVNLPSTLAKQLNWMHTTVELFQDSVVLEGHLGMNESSYWGALAKTKRPKKSKLLGFVPLNFACFYHLAIEELVAELRQEKDKIGDFESYFLPWLGDELAFILSEPKGYNLSNDVFIVVKANNINTADSLLMAYGEERGLLKAFKYQNYDVRQLPSGGFFQRILGRELPMLNNPYYVLVDDCVVFANSQSSLENWVVQYNFDKTIDKSPKYRHCINDFKKGNSIYGILNTPYAYRLLLSKLKEDPDLRKSVLSSFQQFKSIYPIGIEVNVEKDQLYLRAKAIYNKQEQKQHLAWRYSLKADVVKAPQVLLSKIDNQYYTWIQDNNHRLYCINRAGELVWEHLLDSTVQSSFYSIDYYGNGMNQVCFNTSRFIYTLDFKGRVLNKIPLIAKSTAALTLVDDGFEAFYYIPCANGDAYAYRKDGVPVPGWNPLKSVGNIKQPIQYMKYKGKHYFALYNAQGGMQLYNEEGVLYLGKENIGAKGSMLYLDAKVPRVCIGLQDGRIQVVNLQGASFYLSANTGMEQGVQFTYTNIWGDSRKDYLRWSKQEIALHAYEGNKFKKIFSQRLDEDIDKVLTVKDLQKEPCLGLLSKRLQSLRIINLEGKVIVGPLVGSTDFEIKDLYSDGDKTLIVASRNMLYAYKLKL